MAIERILLAPDLTISRVVTGLWQVADMERSGREVDPSTAAAAIDDYLAAGLSTFDMADHYGSSELLVGHYLRQQHGSAGSLQALTKWVPEPGPSNRADARAAVDRALARLESERIDLLQFHPWSYSDPRYLDSLFHLDELRREGKIHHLGVTNCDTAHLRILLASGLPIVSNQVCYSLLDQRARGAMTALCQEHGVQLLAFGTLAGGLLTERWLARDEPRELSTWSEMKYKRFVDSAGGWDALQSVLRALDAVGTRHRVSMANIASRFILEQPQVGAVIIGARLGQSEHITDTGKLFGFALSAEDHQEIEVALDGLQPIPGDCGDEYRQPPFLTASGDLSHHVTEFPAPYPRRSLTGSRSAVSSGTPWEPIAGYSRAIREGRRILVSGTTATHGERLIGGEDPSAQTHFVIDKLEGAIRSLGGRLGDVVRTRVYVKRVEDVEAVARAHGERFGSILPANTMVHAELIGDEYLVEIEAEAVVGDDPL